MRVIASWRCSGPIVATPIGGVPDDWRLRAVPDSVAPHDRCASLQECSLVIPQARSEGNRFKDPTRADSPSNEP